MKVLTSLQQQQQQQKTRGDNQAYVFDAKIYQLRSALETIQFEQPLFLSTLQLQTRFPFITVHLSAAGLLLSRIQQRSEEVLWSQCDQMASGGTTSTVGQRPVACWFALVFQMFGENVIS